MSKFGYNAEGELNSQYLLDLLNDYLDKLLTSNDTKGIVENNVEVDTKASRFLQWFRDATKRIGLKFKNNAGLDNYNKVVVTQYVKSIQDKLQIFLQTNVLEAKQIFELKQTLMAIKFDVVLPELDENREKVIRKSEKQFLKSLNDVKYLKNADIDYILFNTPVDELKPFISDKVSIHKADIMQISKLIRRFVSVRHNELIKTDFEPYDIEFEASERDFYNDNITDNGIGEEVERFVRSKMIEKLNISSQEENLLEDRLAQINEIDVLLKRLKLNKIELMLHNLIKLKTNKAQVKEVIDKCKDTINSSTITNKSAIFLLMDNLYYKLCKKCEALEQKAKLKLQLVDKVKMFATLEQIQNPSLINIPKRKQNKQQDDHADQSDNSITSNLYDDEEEDVNIIEEEGDNEPEEEVVIEEENE